ncbi:MAG: preprotein translocase subunit YajC [Acidobacteriota bacterium]|jgi:preprotein translocase subunit YajC|nr:preprotein translocase subunit YajC [Acidobacteriota bacterium]
MADLRILLALAGPAGEGEPNPMASLVMMGLIFAVFYFVLILPMRRKQKKLETLVKQLKTGDKVLLNSGIFGTITGVEEEAFQIRIDDKTRIKVLKSAVAGLQPEPGSPTEK